jgi:hypothetical protein
MKRIEIMFDNNAFDDQKLKIYFLNTIITKFLNDVRNKKNKKNFSFVEYFEKNINDVHRKSRKISKFNDIVANENIVAFLTIQKRIDQS